MDPILVQNRKGLMIWPRDRSSSISFPTMLISKSPTGRNDQSTGNRREEAKRYSLPHRRNWIPGTWKRKNKHWAFLRGREANATDCSCTHWLGRLTSRPPCSKAKLQDQLRGCGIEPLNCMPPEGTESGYLDVMEVWIAFWLANSSFSPMIRAIELPVPDLKQVIFSFLTTCLPPNPSLIFPPNVRVHIVGQTNPSQPKVTYVLPPEAQIAVEAEGRCS